MYEIIVKQDNETIYATHCEKLEIVENRNVVVIGSTDKRLEVEPGSE